MSPNKRRKLEEGQELPKSAISALTARRRLAAGASREASPPPEDEVKQRTGNSFSVLQRLSQPEKASPKSPRTPRPGQKEGTGKRSTERGASTEDSGTSTPKVILYSSFRLSKQNHRRKNGVTELRLSSSDRFIVLGSFGIRIRSGEVSLLGAIISASETVHWIHAPHCHALPVIRTSEKTHLELHNDNADKPLTCLAALSPLYQRIWTETDNEVDGEGDVDSSGDSFKILFTSEDAPKKSIIQELNSPPEWNKAISDLATSMETDQRTQLSVLVCGPKSAGKSTFSKLLTNRLVTSKQRPAGGQSGTGVAIIDLDPGQPEYAPAGTVSLVHVTQPNLGTPFSHPGLQQSGHAVLRCHALASTSPASSPSLYIQCAIDLFETYRRTLRNCPLLINTPGWILGTGLDLLVELIAKIMPSQVVYMSEEGPVDVVDVLRSTTRKTFLTLPSQPSEYTTRTAAHLRAMQAMSYFHQADVEGPAASAPAVLSWIPQPISAVPPWQVRYSSKKSGIRGILSYDYQSPPELSAAAINGMVVAVVEIEDGDAFRDIITGYQDSAPAEIAGGQQQEEEEEEEENGVPTTTNDDDNVAAVEDSAAAAAAAAVAHVELKIAPSPEGLPMIANTNDATLDPRYSRTLGLALVRGIDAAAQRLQLLTPIPHAVIQAARSRGHDLVLVHGKFDAPTWAYAEDFFFRRAAAASAAAAVVGASSSDPESSSSLAASRAPGDDDLEVTYDNTSDDDSDIAQDHVQDVQDVKAVPWLEILQGNQKRPVGSRVWRVRRDLGRSTGD